MNETLVSLFAHSANRFPHAEAVVYKNQRISYEQLWREANNVSAYLTKNGLKKGDRVALLMENSPHFVSAYYGVLACGGVVVALNTAAKAKDLHNWVAHSGAKWMIADVKHPELSHVSEAGNGECKVVTVDLQVFPLGLDHMASGTETMQVHLNSHDTASIIYTSGTTGAPKGVTLSHGNLLANIQSILNYLQLSEKDRILNVLPFYYSYGNSVLHTHLAVGATVVLQNSLAYPHQVVQSMVDERVTGFSGVPSTFALLLSRVNLSEYDLTGVRYMTQAGGKMASAQIQRLLDAVPGIEFYVMYGQTEATARIAYLPPVKLFEKLGAAGIPIPGVSVQIRNEQGEIVPPGTVGEIFVHGENIMQGYWENPEATQKVIHDGWLKTGDLAYMDAEGYIFIQGRNSEMIKAGANRISPQEIEEVITELDAVAEVAVVGVPDDILGEVIKAVVVKRNGQDIAQRDIQAHCRKNLAMYKVPKHIEFAHELPKTASGKIRRYMLSGQN